MATAGSTKHWPWQRTHHDDGKVTELRMEIDRLQQLRDQQIDHIHRLEHARNEAVIALQDKHDSLSDKVSRAIKVLSDAGPKGMH